MNKILKKNRNIIKFLKNNCKKITLTPTQRNRKKQMNGPRRILTADFWTKRNSNKYMTYNFLYWRMDIDI